MTQQTTWSATLAPIGIPGQTGQIIDPKCVITVREKAPLYGLDGTPIGHVTSVTTIDDHIVVTGTLNPDKTIPNVLPTFDGGFHDQRTFSPIDSNDPHIGTVTFHTMEINAVRTGFKPAWPDDPEIMFA